MSDAELPFIDNEWWRLPLWVASLYAFNVHARYYRRRGWSVSERLAKHALGALIVNGPDGLGANRLYVHRQG